MKKILLILLFVPVFADAQQPQKQLARLLENIAANKVYIDYLEKGYRIAHSGLTTIRDIKQGDFTLHLHFFDSLQKVNPRLKKWTKVADIIIYQLRILTHAKQILLTIRQEGQFSSDELAYCKSVFDNLLVECAKGIDELVLLVTDGEATLTDDERMKRIDALYTGLQDKYAFAASFGSDLGLLSAQRINERAEILMDKKINGL